MNIGLIGPGEIGSVIVRKLRDAGHSEKLANSKGPDARVLAT
jgi:predicted dinucleotide-binding enzyme